MQKQRELDRLVSTIYDDGVSEQDLRRLEALLAEDPALQERYWQLVSTHVALGVSIGAARGAELPNAGRVVSLNCSKPHDSLVRRTINKFNASETFRLAAVVAFFAVFAAAWNHFSLSERIGAPREAANQSLHWTVDRMPTITRVSWDGPSFSQDVEQWKPIAAVEAGSISLQMKQGQSADGYLFCLPPGAAVELVATFDATGENCLSVSEIIAGDQRPVRKATFNNSGVGPRPLHANSAAKNRRYGVLGRWGELNTSTSPRYFLLTGSHKLAAPAPQEDWQLSDMAVLLKRDDVIHIGWDDSGPAPSEGQTYRQDDDFDDLAATLFISKINSPVSEEDALQVFGDVRMDGSAAPPLAEAYRLTLAPGEAALLKAASDAAAPNALFVVDAENKAVRWASSNRATHSMNLGAAAVFNRSDSPRELLIVAVHQAEEDAGASAPWRGSTMKSLYEQAGFVILGFEDAKQDDDFNDVRVSVLRGAYSLSARTD